MDKNLTALEIVGLGIRSEEEAAKFYGAISKKIKNNLVRTKYEELAREETRHREILTALYKNMTGEKDLPSKIPGKPETAEGKKVENVEDLEQLLKIAIKREQEASKFYQDGALKATDHSGQRTLEYLANIERGHETMLKVELEAYLRDRDWYANNPEIQLVG